MNSATEVKPFPWIIGKNFDFFFICGGAVWILVALNYMLVGSIVPISSTGGPIAARWLMVANLFGQHLSADAHNAATYMRIYGSTEDRQHFHFYGKWLALACIPIFLLGITVPGLGGAMVYLYLITVFWHYAAQAFGICLIYCYKQGYSLTKLEKGIFRWLILCFSAFVAVRMLTFKNLGPTYFYGITIPFWGPLPGPLYRILVALLVILAAAFVGVVIKKFIVEHKLIPWAVPLCLSVLALLGLSEGIISAIAWFYVPVFFHGSQYIAICMSYYLKEKGLPQGMATSQIGSLMLSPLACKYFLTIVFVGAFLYVFIPHFFQSLGFDYALVAGVVLATVNFHHFNTDAAIWRLRDVRCREILLA